MLAETTARMAFPLAALDAAGPLRSKAQLHMLAYVAQREYRGRMQDGRRQETWYDFGDGGGVPRSSLLDRDVSENPSMVEHRVITQSGDGARAGHSYRITDIGRERLALMGAGAAPGTIGDMGARIRVLRAGMPAALMDEVYGTFRPGADLALLEGRIRGTIARMIPEIRRAYKISDSWRVSAFGEILETVGKVIDGMGSREIGADQARVILCMSDEIARGCEDLGDLDGHSDPDAPDPHLSDVDDLAACLFKYCEKNGMMKDPMSKSLGELLGKKKTYDLCEEILQIND